jgi:hypothetical protein
MAYSWLDIGAYKPSATELVSFFEDAQCKTVPTVAEAERSLKNLVTGCYMGKVVRHWCGIFACSILANCNLDVRWDLNQGKPVGGAGSKGFKVHWGNKELQPGDIGVIQQYQHHFVITEVDEEKKLVRSVDGNQKGNCIMHRQRSISELYAHYSFEG